MTTLLPGAAWHPVPGNEHTGPQVGGTTFPWRAVMHTTEGNSLAGNLATYAGDGWFPHFTIDIAGRTIWQHLDLDEFATAVDHQSSWPFETNKLNCVQAEILGRAVDMPKLREADLIWLGKAYCAELVKLKPIALYAPPFEAYPASYGTSAACRMTIAQWETFNGFCGHEHVPWNVHGDPGALNMARVLRAAVATKPPVTPNIPAPVSANEDEDMLIEQPKRTKNPTRPAVAALDKTSKTVILFNGASLKGDQATPYGFRLWRVPTNLGLAGWKPSATGVTVVDAAGRAYGSDWQ